jgi:pSer/pThr/pTyr-binding forkhead associated (FHA) protein
MKLVFPDGEHPQALLSNGINRIGSEPDAHIVLDRPGVQARHCELHVNVHGVVLQVSQGASVQVNERDVEGLISLRAGDLLSFDRIHARLAAIDAPGSAGQVEVRMPMAENDAAEVTTVRPALPRYVLRGISGAGFGRTFPLLAATTLGRAPDCGIRFEHPGLSRRHARLTPTAEGLLIEDLGSTNGCVLNDKRIDRGWAQHGDEIGIDALRFRVVKPGTDEPVEVAARSSAGSATRQRGKSAMRWTAAIVGLAAIVVLIAFAIRAMA